MIWRLIVQITGPKSVNMFFSLSLSLAIVIIGMLIGNVGIGGPRSHRRHKKPAPKRLPAATRLTA